MRRLTRKAKPTGGWVMCAQETQRRRAQDLELEPSARAAAPSEVRRKSKGVQLELGLGRAERCIGLAIRKGQEEGRIAKRGTLGPGRQRDGSTGTISSAAEFAGEGKERRDTYAMTDGVSTEQFDTAIETAKAEKNLSRANVVRKVKGENDLEPSDSRRTSWN